MAETSIKQILQATTTPDNAPDTHIDALGKRLQRYFPDYDIDDLLSRSGLIIDGNLDPMLVYNGLVKIAERLPGSNALVLDVYITERGVQVIREMLPGYLYNNDN